jgi:hypothetical protein
MDLAALFGAFCDSIDANAGSAARQIHNLDIEIIAKRIPD